MQDDNKKASKLKAEGLSKGSEDIEEVPHYQYLPYVPKTIGSELIKRYYNDFLVGYFGIEKMQELIARKYYLLMLQKNIEAYVKGCNIYFPSKVVCYKPNGNL